MPETVPNQKLIVIHRDMPNTNFMQIKNENWMEFNKKHGPFALQFYLYFAKNADGYNLALSKQAALKEAGIKSTTYYKYLELLINEGYLVWRNGNTLDFYETPHKQEDKDLRQSPCGELDKPQQEQQNLLEEHRSPPNFAKSPQSDKEIDNRYTDITDNLQIGPDSPHQLGKRANSAAEQEGFNF